MLKYSINIAWSDEDKGYIATIPEFKNLSAFGETYEKALKEAKVVVDGYIESLKADKISIPEPHKVSKYSGQIRLRMPKRLHETLVAEAIGEDVSLNSYMVYLLTKNHYISKSWSVIESIVPAICRATGSDYNFFSTKNIELPELESSLTGTKYIKEGRLQW